MSTQLETRTRSLARRLLDVVGVWLGLALIVLAALVLLRAGLSVLMPEPARPTVHTF